jgi:hypothetical protein
MITLKKKISKKSPFKILFFSLVINFNFIAMENSMEILNTSSFEEEKHNGSQSVEVFHEANGKQYKVLIKSPYNYKKNIVYLEYDDNKNFVFSSPDDDPRLFCRLEENSLSSLEIDFMNDYASKNHINIHPNLVASVVNTIQLVAEKEKSKNPFAHWNHVELIKYIKNEEFLNKPYDIKSFDNKLIRPYVGFKRDDKKLTIKFNANFNQVFLINTTEMCLSSKEAYIDQFNLGKTNILNNLFQILSDKKNEETSWSNDFDNYYNEKKKALENSIELILSNYTNMHDENFKQSFLELVAEYIFAEILKKKQTYNIYAFYKICNSVLKNHDEFKEQIIGQEIIDAEKIKIKAEIKKQKQLEKEKQKQLEKEKQKQLEKEKQKQLEKEKKQSKKGFKGNQDKMTMGNPKSQPSPKKFSLDEAFGGINLQESGEQVDLSMIMKQQAKPSDVKK